MVGTIVQKLQGIVVVAAITSAPATALADEKIPASGQERTNYYVKLANEIAQKSPSVECNADTAVATYYHLTGSVKVRTANREESGEVYIRHVNDPREYQAHSGRTDAAWRQLQANGYQACKR